MQIDASLMWLNDILNSASEAVSLLCATGRGGATSLSVGDQQLSATPASPALGFMLMEMLTREIDRSKCCAWKIRAASQKKTEIHRKEKCTGSRSCVHVKTGTQSSCAFWRTLAFVSSTCKMNTTLPCHARASLKKNPVMSLICLDISMLNTRENLRNI